MHSLNDNITLPVGNNSVYNLSNKQESRTHTSALEASFIALSILCATYGFPDNNNFKQNSSVPCIEYNNVGTINTSTFPQLGMKEKVIGMVTQEYGVPALVVDVISKMNNFEDVINVSHSINNDVKSVEFYVSVFMPKYNRTLMRQLIAIKIDAENLADTYQYVLNFEYIPLMDRDTKENYLL